MLPVHDNDDVWEAPRVTIVGLSVQVNPVEGVDAEVRATIPVNPLTGAIVIVEVAEDPALALALVGVAVTLKS